MSRTVAKEKRNKLKGDAAAGKLDMGQRVKDLLFPAAIEKYLQYYKANRRPSSYLRHFS